MGPAHRTQRGRNGDLTVLVSRLGELLMGLGLDGLLSSNNFLLEDREKQKGFRSEPTIFIALGSVCLHMNAPA